MDQGAARRSERECGVALLVDFENTILGLGENSAKFDPTPLFKLGEEYGDVLLAKAYADWRYPKLNTHQIALDKAGMDVIHVFGKSHDSRIKNGVDVKMAVDAIELIWTHPHIGAFVVVSGDRDFIHLLKSLRRYGKVVVGVSPSAATSEDFADLCDRFVRFESLLKAYDGDPTPTAPASPAGEVRAATLDDVRRELRGLLQAHPEGVKGALVKPELRKRLSSTFDQSDFGFRRMSQLLAALPDIVRVEPNKGAGDISLFAATPPKNVAKPPPAKQKAVLPKG